MNWGIKMAKKGTKTNVYLVDKFLKIHKVPSTAALPHGNSQKFLLEFPKGNIIVLKFNQWHRSCFFEPFYAAFRDKESARKFVANEKAKEKEKNKIDWQIAGFEAQRLCKIGWRPSRSHQT